MVADRQLWARRVAAWKVSGLTSEAFSGGQPFSASGLRYWAHRLRKEVQPATRKAMGSSTIRIGRVLRAAAPAPSGDGTGAKAEGPPRASTEKPAPATAAPHAVAPLVVELGAARVSVPSGFDRETLVAVLGALSVRGAQ